MRRARSSPATCGTPAATSAGWSAWATDSEPQLWGLHNYGDVTYATTEGTDAVLRRVPGQLWIEETGGIVVLRNAAGRITLSFNEERAAASIGRAFAIAAARPRITRMYIYHWQSGPTSRFDAGLIRPDSSLRPSYAAVLRGIAGQPAASATAPASASSTLRWSAAWSKARPAILLVRVRCTATAARCAGRVVVKLRTRRTSRSATRVATVATRTYRTRSTAPVQTLRVRVGTALRKRLRASSARRLALTVRPGTPAGATGTVTLRLAKPG